MHTRDKWFVVLGLVFLSISLILSFCPVSAEKYSSTTYFVGQSIINAQKHDQIVGDNIETINPQNKSNYNYHGATSTTIVNGAGNAAGIDQTMKVEAAYTNKYSMTKHVEVDGNGYVSTDTVGMADYKPAISPLECTASNPTVASGIAKDGQVASTQMLEQEYTTMGATGVTDLAHSVQNANVSVSQRSQNVVGSVYGRIGADAHAGLDVNTSTEDYRLNVNEHFLVTGNETVPVNGESNMKWEDFSSPYRMTSGAATSKSTASNVTAANEELANATANTTAGLDNKAVVMEFKETAANQTS